MKAREMREETADGLAERLKETQKALFQHRTRIAAGEGINPHASRSYRKDIARLKTLLRAIEMVSEGRGCTNDEAKKLLDGNRWSPERAIRSQELPPASAEVVFEPKAQTQREPVEGVAPGAESAEERSG